MDTGNGHFAGLLELALVFALVIAFGVHQLLDLRRERLKRDVADQETRGSQQSRS